MPVRRPTSVADVCAIVKESRAAKEGVYPVGGRTTLDVGLPPINPGVALDMTALDRVIDYPARDMTITVEAGITLAALQAELAKEGQWLPIDVPSPEKATLGGAIALNKSGPRRYGHGTLRDYIIGISFVTDDGVEVKAGGRVVKNVAGYDLMKLQIGAVGTLGVITQVTLKVKPKPEASAAIMFGVAGDSLGLALDRMHESKTRPVAVEVLNREAWHATDTAQSIDSEWVVAVGFEEKAATVAWQLAALRNELQSVSVQGATEVPDPSGLWSRITDLQLRAESLCIGKASIRPSQVAGYVRDQEFAFPDTLIHAHALNGIIWMHGSEVHYNPSTKTGAQRESLERLVALGTNTVVKRAPTSSKEGDVWGRHDRIKKELVGTLKKTLDPDNVFNPGRLFGDM